jgi:hypothetical protein
MLSYVAVGFWILASSAFALFHLHQLRQQLRNMREAETVARLERVLRPIRRPPVVSFDLPYIHPGE